MLTPLASIRPLGRFCLCLLALVAGLTARAGTLAEALGTPSLVWSAGGTGTWVEAQIPGPPVVSGIGWEMLSTGQSGWVETAVTGPGVMRFAWQQMQYDYHSRLFVDGLLATEVTGFWGGTPGLLVELGSGTHTLRWTFAGSAPAKAVILGGIQWQPGTNAGLAEGLDLPADVIVAQWYGTPEWSGASNAAGRSDVASSGCVRYDTQITVFVVGPARINFAAHISSECDPYGVDGVGLLYELAGGGAQNFTYLGSMNLPSREAWQNQTLLIGPGRQALRLYFETDDADVTILLDALTMDRTNPPTPAEVLSPNASQPWRFSSARWEVTPQGADGVGGPTTGGMQVPLSAPEWLETDVTGPVLADLSATGLTTGPVTVQATIDGVAVPVVRATTFSQWVKLRIPVPAGLHALRWMFTPAAGAPANVKVDDFKTPLVPAPDGLADALGLPGGLFYMNVPDAVSIDDYYGRHGEGAHFDGCDNPELVLLLPPGPEALISFWRRGSATMLAWYPYFSSLKPVYTSPPPAYDWMQEELIMPGSAFWTQVSLTIGGEDTRVFLDDLTVDRVPISLEEAADDEGAVWTAQGAVALHSSVLSKDGVDAIFLMGGWAQREVEGPALVHVTRGLPDPQTDAGAISTLTLSLGMDRYAWVPPGGHTLRWNGTGVLDQIMVKPAIPLAVALGVAPAGISASPGVFGSAFGENIPPSSVAVFGPATVAGPLWLQLEVTGPSSLAWAEYSQSIPFRCLVDGSVVTPKKDGARRWLLIPSDGAHIVRWEWHAASIGLMDFLEVAPAPPLTPANAFAGVGLVFSSEGPASWRVERTYYYGQWVVWLAPPASGDSWLNTWLTGPADFSWQVQGSGAVSVRMDGRITDNYAMSGTYGFDGSRISVPEGTHLVQWKMATGMRMAGFWTERPGVSAAIGALAGKPAWPWWLVDQADYTSAATIATLLRGPATLQYALEFPTTVVRIQEKTAGLLTAGLPAGQQVWLPPGDNAVHWTATYHTASSSVSALTTVPAPAMTLESLPGAGFSPFSHGSGLSWSGFEPLPGRKVIAPDDGLRPGETTWLEADAAGPALLEFSPQLLLPEASVRLILNGRAVWSGNFTGAAGLAPMVRWPLPAATQRVRWEILRAAGSGQPLATGYLEGVKLLPLPPLSTAMGAPSLTWTGSPEAAHYFDGTAARPAAPDAGPGTWLETTVTGPAALDIQWMNPSHTVEVNGRPLVSASVDPVNTSTIPSRYISGTLLFPAGAWRVRWVGAAPVPPVALRSLTSPFAGGTGPTAAVYYVTRNPLPQWVENASEGYNTAPSLRAAGAASLWLPVEGPGMLRFAWKTALTLSLNGATCYVDGVQAAIAARGSMPWQEAAVAVPPGWHRVQWVSRSYSTTSLDDLRWQPGTAFGQWADERIPGWTDRAPEADADSDGLANLMEFTLGLDPTQPDLWQPPARWLPVEQVAEFTFPRAAAPPDQATLTIEISADLSTWLPAEQTAGASLTLSPGRQTLRLSPPWKFARMRARL